MARFEIKDISQLPDRLRPTYEDTQKHEFLSLKWPSPPRNVLLVRKEGVKEVTASLVEFANHIHRTYTPISIILEPRVAFDIHTSFDFPIYTTLPDEPSYFHDKVDLTATFGGDGTILHASSLFANTSSVPPILTFGMGTLGFLGECKFFEYKRAFREVYMSGSGLAPDRASAMEYAHDDSNNINSSSTSTSISTSTTPPTSEESMALDTTTTTSGWSSLRGKTLGSSRSARILLRQRLKVGTFDSSGGRIGLGSSSPRNPNITTSSLSDIHAMNEVNIHRGRDPHLAIVDVSVGGRFLTEAVADGMIVSTPTGSTAYSLSSGGSIVHPLVPSLLLTPICPRSLSFRPLVLPANTVITLRLSEKNRAKEVEVSIDGVAQRMGLSVGMELRVRGEEIKVENGNGGEYVGGIPCIVRGSQVSDGVTDVGGDDAWVGGLNGLLKFNYPFGEEGRESSP
ncbi:MAG: NADH kinase pos5 [Cirrosporium novae-zelandiae]|nr:MAG: NADH kinase pos5 [Cirrosporium novae-zelandiae]